VTLEILDAAGDTIRRYSSADRPAPVDPGTLNIPAFWRPTPATLPASAGHHRWTWDLRVTPPAQAAAGTRGSGAGAGSGGSGGRGGAAPALPGRYTVRLTVDGKSYTQPLRVDRDPRAGQAGR
jgi:hypothetical protein